MKNRTWIIIFALLITLCICLYAFSSGMFLKGSTAVIYQDGRLVEKINLDTLTDSRKIVLTGDAGENVIIAEKGSIKMLSAQCPDQVCVNHGELKKGGTPIVCLPNKIVIRLEEDASEYDGKTG